LAERPQIIALNKIDVPDAKDLAEMVAPMFVERGYRVFPISTASHEGLKALSFALAEMVSSQRSAEAVADVPRIVIRPQPVDEKDFSIRVEGPVDERMFRVLGAKPERWVAQTDFSNDEAVGYLADRLARLGVEEALFAKGAVPGSAVVIGERGGVVFDWEPTLTSAAELTVGPRGSDDRLAGPPRRSTRERREEYTERMDAKQAARDELAREREAGLWTEEDDNGAG
jgi:GTP-binding protein